MLDIKTMRSVAALKGNPNWGSFVTRLRMVEDAKLEELLAATLEYLPEARGKMLVLKELLNDIDRAEDALAAHRAQDERSGTP